MRSRVIAPLNSPEYIGEYTIAPIPLREMNGRVDGSTSRASSEYGGCRDVIGPMDSARIICAILKFDTPKRRTLPSRCRAIIAWTASSMEPGDAYSASPFHAGQ